MIKNVATGTLVQDQKQPLFQHEIIQASIAKVARIA
jgi:hypothetical protein